MAEEIDLYLDDAKEKMENTVKHLETEFTRMRAGKASPQILDGINVDYYGNMTPLNQVANINTPEAKTLVIQPWDKSVIEAIEKAIMAANIGLTPVNNGELIRINIPPLTEERRKDLVKRIKSEGENAKVSIRNSRRDVNDELKTLKKEGISEDEIKNAETEVQKITDAYIEKVDDLMERKEKDVMTI